MLLLDHYIAAVIMNEKLKTKKVDVESNDDRALAVLRMLNNWSHNIHDFVLENPELIKNFAAGLSNLMLGGYSDRQWETWRQSAEQGWYINSKTPGYMRKVILEKNVSVLDQNMVKHLRDDWGELTQSILSAYPERREILECAFALHVEGNYIASIPLMFTQIDGVCHDMLNRYYFADGKGRQEKIEEMLLDNDSFSSVLLKTVRLTTQFSLRIEKYLSEAEPSAPNRNCIMHGARGSLQYGTEINSFKVFSMLAFFHMVNEVIS